MTPSASPAQGRRPLHADSQVIGGADLSDQEEQHPQEQHRQDDSHGQRQGEGDSWNDGPAGNGGSGAESTSIHSANADLSPRRRKQSSFKGRGRSAAVDGQLLLLLLLLLLFSLMSFVCDLDVVVDVVTFVILSVLCL